MHQDPVNELKRLKQLRRNLFEMCERQLKVVSKQQRILGKKVDISELYDPLLDIWKELK